MKIRKIEVDFPVGVELPLRKKEEKAEQILTDWPKSPTGRFLCSLEHPMPENALGRWEHDDVEEAGDQENGWPGGDIVTMRCRCCGKTWSMELPQ